MNKPHVGLANENDLWLIADQRIYVERFDEFCGLDSNVLTMINNRIREVRVQAEYQITRMKQQNELLANQVA
jgi:hypothetical protein